MIRHLDLRTGQPVWTAYRRPRVAATKLMRDVKCDVLVVGMGVSGAMIAEALTADGLDVVAVDRRGPIKGSTPATTALVMSEIDQPLSILSGKIGKEKAARGWQRSRLALAALKARVQSLDIKCDMTERRALYLAGNVLDSTGLQEEVEARRSVGLDAHYLKRSNLVEAFGIDRKGAILSHDDVLLDPIRLTAGLLKAAQARGARFHAPVEAIEFKNGANSVTVSTDTGSTIEASYVVLATGFELTTIVPASRHRIISTYAIATKPQKRSLTADLPLIWEASDPYLYLRALPDGRIVCGGEDEEFTDEEKRDALLEQKTAHIVAKLEKLLPWVDARPDFAWAGSFGTTSTGMPLIGPVPRHSRIHAVMGYGGNGITWSQIASEIVRTAIAGGKDADAELFTLA